MRISFQTMLLLLSAAMAAGFHSAAQAPAGGGPAREQRLLDELWTSSSIAEAARVIQQEIEELRGRSFLAPITVLLETRAALRLRVREGAREICTPEESLAEEMSAKLFGLIPPDFDLQRAALELLDEQNGAFYDEATSTLYLAEDYSQGAAQLVLVRCLTRIFDEQHYQLTKWTEDGRKNSDALLAMRAVAAGSASASEASWRTRYSGRLSERERAYWPTTLDPDQLADVPPYLWKPVVAFALRGYTFLQRSSVLSILLQEARMEDIERALGDLPVSTEQVLHPVKYWDERREDLPRSIEFDSASLPAGWEIVREDTLGELYIGILVDPNAGLSKSRPRQGSPYAGTQYTSAASEGWDGDRFLLLRRGESWILHMVSAWDEIADAGEFYNALEQQRPAVAENLGALAPPGDGEGSGVQIQFGRVHDQVLYTAWVGLAAKEAQRIVASLTYTVAG